MTLIVASAGMTLNHAASRHLLPSRASMSFCSPGNYTVHVCLSNTPLKGTHAFETGLHACLHARQSRQGNELPSQTMIFCCKDVASTVRCSSTVGQDQCFSAGMTLFKLGPHLRAPPNSTCGALSIIQAFMVSIVARNRMLTCQAWCQVSMLRL